MPQNSRTLGGVLSGVLGLVGLSAVAGLLVTATVTPAIAVSGYAASSAITMFDNLPSYLEVDRPMQPTTLYANDPNTGGTYELASFYDQNREPVSYDQISPVMYDAILSSEDPRYYQHGGVDLLGTTRAVLSNLRGSAQTQGGSSISQQYVKNVLIQKCEQQAPNEEELRDCWVKATESTGNEGIERKLQEMRYAIAIEKEYSKNDILLGYLNIANFGGVTYGVQAAALYYFGVPASDLTIGQAAALAGMVQNPNKYRIDKPEGSYSDQDGNPVNSAEDGYAGTKKRQSYVLGRMLKDGKITQEQYDAEIAEPIQPNIVPRNQGCVAAGGAAYFCQYVKDIILTDPAFGETAEDRADTLRRGGLNIYTTLDTRVQGPAEEAMGTLTPTWYEGMQFGSAGVTLEATSGRILSLTQNTVFSEDQALVSSQPGYSSLVYAGNSTLGKSGGFPVGSTYKIFTLIDWLEQGHSVREVVDGTNRTFNMKCHGSTVSGAGTQDIGNFGGQPGFRGSVVDFTRLSLNTGFLAMASQLDLCDINAVADRMGVTLGNGTKVTETNVPFDVLGSKNISPMAMAGAYATVANNGVYCQPKAIDRVTDADGNDLPVPQTSCSQAIAPEIAHTAAYALQTVMDDGGTGSRAHPNDDVPLIGKTGTHNAYQSAIATASSNTSTFIWVGNTSGEESLFGRWYGDNELSDIRYSLANWQQGAANAVYGGHPFPEPDANLTRKVLKDLPSVVGMSIDDATAALEKAGFNATVGEPEAGDQAEGMITRQDPGPGQVPGGTDVTIFPSNGQKVGTPVPDVTGMTPQEAFKSLIAAGFTGVRNGECTEDPKAGGGKVTSTDPAAGTPADPSTSVTVNYSAKKCR